MALIDRYRRLREEMDAESISKRLSAIEDRLWYGPPGSAECSILAEELHEARQRGADERTRGSLDPSDLLILCVGYSPEPLLLAIAYHAAAHVALLEEMQIEQAYLRSLERLWDSYRDVLGVSSFAQLDRRTTKDSAAGVFLLVREIAERWRDRRER
jgi:hypothetical protein